MTQNIDIEIKVIKKFVIKDKQDRYLQFISNPKNRHKFIDDLAHFNHFKWDSFEKVNGGEANHILNVLKKNKLENKSCYIISDNKEIDCKTLSTEMAVQNIGGYRTGTILVFGDAEIIFYEGESMKESYLSKLMT